MQNLEGISKHRITINLGYTIKLYFCQVIKGEGGRGRKYEQKDLDKKYPASQKGGPILLTQST